MGRTARLAARVALVFVACATILQQCNANMTWNKCNSNVPLDVEQVRHRA